MRSAALEGLIDMMRSQSGAAAPSVEDLRTRAKAGSGMTPLVDGTVVTAALAGSVPMEWVEAPGAIPGRTVIHLHGGGYAVGSPDSSRPYASRLSAACRSRIMVLDYRLAPEHPFPAAIEDATAAYRWAIDGGADPAKTALCGESSGGGLVLATLLALRDRAAPLPALAVCCSPWTDLTMSGGTIRSKADVDPLVREDLLTALAQAYLGDGDKKMPLASPLFGDLKGLPPLLIQVGTAEILLDDSLRFADAARAAGVDVQVDVWDDMVHTWQLFAPFVPEGQAAIDKIGQFVDSRLV
jgi:acetyl esterase/lipase